ncbi:MAG: hypothetical protein ACK4ZW_05720 [Blastomonas sp.]
MSDRASSAHNAALRPALKLIVEAAKDEAGQWVLLESLCLGIGMLHGRSNRDTAVFIETMAERIATGERTTNV